MCLKHRSILPHFFCREVAWILLLERICHVKPLWVRLWPSVASRRGKQQTWGPGCVCQTLSGHIRHRRRFQSLVAIRFLVSMPHSHFWSLTMETSHRASHAGFLAMLLTQSPVLHVLTRLPAHRFLERRRPSGMVHSCCDR